MNNYCTKCGEKLENAIKCPKCGQDVADLSEKNSNNSFLLFLKIFVGIISIIILSIFIIIVFNKISTKIKGKNYIDEYLIEDLKKEYSVDKNRITYEKRKSCMREYNTCAGDAGSGREKIKGCYIYYYDIKLDNGKTSKAYIKDDNGTINIFNEFYYTTSSYDILEYYNSNFNDKAKLEFYYFDVSEDVDYVATLDALNKNLVITTSSTTKEVFNKTYAEKFVNLTKYAERFKNTKNIDDFSVNIKFSDGYLLTFEEYNQSFFFEKGEYGRKNYTAFRIGRYVTDDIIRWCVDNRKDSILYYKYNTVKEGE